MPIEGCISLSKARAKAHKSSAAITSINNTNNTINPIKVVANTKPKIATSNETTNESFVKQGATSIFLTVDIAFPYENYIQQGLQIIKENRDIGKKLKDTRIFIDEDQYISIHVEVGNVGFQQVIFGLLNKAPTL